METKEQDSVKENHVEDDESKLNKKDCSMKLKAKWLEICTAIAGCAVIIILIVSLGVLFARHNTASVPAEQDKDLISSIIKTLDTLTSVVSDLQKNFTSDFDGIQVILSNELASQSRVNHQLVLKNITMIAEKFAQHEQQTNNSLVEIAQQFKAAMDNSELKIALLNQTIVEKGREIQELSTQNEQLRAQIAAMNGSLQSTNTEIQVLTEETQGKFSDLTMRLDYSQVQFTSFTSQLVRVNQTVERQDERITTVEIDHYKCNETLERHAEKISQIEIDLRDFNATLISIEQQLEEDDYEDSRSGYGLVSLCLHSLLLYQLLCVFCAKQLS